MLLIDGCTSTEIDWLVLNFVLKYSIIVFRLVEDFTLLSNLNLFITLSFTYQP